MTERPQLGDRKTGGFFLALQQNNLITCLLYYFLRSCLDLVFENCYRLFFANRGAKTGV